MSHTNSRKGYSLPETILYIAVLVSVTVVIIAMIVDISHTRQRLMSAQKISTSASISLDRMVREIRFASDVNTSLSTLGTSPGKLVLTSIDDYGTQKTVEFSLTSNTLHIKENSVDMGPLTEGGVNVTSLIFDRSASSTIQAIRIRMTIESGTTTSYKSDTFYSTAILRQSI